MAPKDNDTLLQEVFELLSENGMGKVARVMEILYNAAMQHERSKVLGAGPYERTEERTGYANGYKEKGYLTRMGRLNLRVPQTRGIAYYPECLEKGERSEKALKAAVAEMWIKGVSTRSVSGIMECLCEEGISADRVSKITKKLEEEVREFFERPLSRYCVLYLDARMERVRHGGHIKKMAVLCAIGVTPEGNREVLGLSCRLSEAEVHWREMLQDLVSRGLSGLELIVSDAHSGLKKALTNVFPTVPWQRCTVHLLRDAKAHIPRRSMEKEVYRDLKDIIEAPDLTQATAMKNKALKKYEKSAPKLSAWIEDNIDEGLTFFRFPRFMWKKIRTTNLIERFNRELKRRTRVVSIFPSEESLYRLVGTLLMEQHDEWISGKRYMVDEE